MSVKFCFVRINRNIPKLLAGVVLGGIAIWCTGAVHYTIWSGWGPAIFLVATVTLLILGCKRSWFWCILAVLELAVIGWFISLSAEHQFRDTLWQSPWGRTPRVTFANSLAEVWDIRDFTYRTPEDFDVHYINDTYDVNQIQSVDVAVSHWDGLQKIAHTMLSFGFADGRYIALSMETRLPIGMEQGFLPGLYKQYGIIMVLATEEDLFRLRTDYRKEELYLYRTNATPEQAHIMFQRLLEGANRLHRKPSYYNSITQNCTTSIAPLLRTINPTFHGDIRLLLNGESDQLLYELGYLAHRDGESFAELKERSLVNQYICPDETDYSVAIRRGQREAK